MATYRPLSVWKGDTFERVYAFKNADKTPADLADMSFVFTVEWPAVAGIPAGSIVKSTGEGGGLILDPTAGTVALALSTLETGQIPTGVSARYDLVWSYQGNVKTLFYGEVKASEWP